METRDPCRSKIVTFRRKISQKKSHNFCKEMILPLFFLIKYSAYNEALIWVAILSAVILTSFFCYLFVHKWNYYDVALPGRCIYKAHNSGLCAKGFFLLNFIYVLRLSPNPWVFHENIWTLYHCVGSIWNQQSRRTSWN